MNSLFKSKAFQGGPTFWSQKSQHQENKNSECISEANVLMY